jgi:hypothetical protein
MTFHRPDGATGLIQICFVVQDLATAMGDYHTSLGAGPWFVGPDPDDEPRGTVYRGVPTALGARIALGYAGDLMIELVEPLAGSMSVFSDWLQERGPGLHHFGFGTHDFAQTLAALERDGRAPIFRSVTPRGARIAMFEAGIGHGALEEYIEFTPEGEAFYAFMRAATSAWDGRELVWSAP